MIRLGALVIACTILVGCASDGHQHSAQSFSPKLASNVYSYASMQLRLATIPDAHGGCTKAVCVKGAEFDRRVGRIGARLADAAYRTDPELVKRVGRFDFTVLDKDKPGTASTAGGQIVVLRPVSGIAPGGAALSFVIAREIGHVALEHHEQNMAISVAFSVLTSVLAPAINVTRLLAAVFSGTTSTAATASMTAASFAGSHAVIESYRPQRREEADAFAMHLLAQFGYGARDVSAGFAHADLQTASSDWMRGLQASVKHLAEKAGRPDFIRTVRHAPLGDAIAAVK